MVHSEGEVPGLLQEGMSCDDDVCERGKVGWVWVGV